MAWRGIIHRRRLHFSGRNPMGEIVNLNRARKARDKVEARRTAEANRLTFGRTRAERQAEQARRERDAAHLDGHRLDDDARD